MAGHNEQERAHEKSLSWQKLHNTIFIARSSVTSYAEQHQSSDNDIPLFEDNNEKADNEYKKD